MTFSVIPIHPTKKKNLHIGVVCSTNGGAFRSLYQAINKFSPFDCTWYVATDRECGIESFCQEQGIACNRFPHRTNAKFSQQAADWFQSFETIDCIQLFYSRLITESLFLTFPTINFHPSLLPAFPGMNAVKRAQQQGARFLGATAHLVDRGVDTGPVIAQTCTPLYPSDSLAHLERISYLQKVHLGLVLLNLIAKNQLKFDDDNQNFTLARPLPATPYCNPSLTCPQLNEAFKVLSTKNLARVV